MAYLLWSNLGLLLGLGLRHDSALRRRARPGNVRCWMARMDPTDRERRSVMRAQLQARLDELRTKVSAEIVPEPEETFNGIAGEVQDAGDASVAIAQTDLRGALLERDVTQLTAVGRALERLEDGSYGRCVDCDLEIDPARLEVLPAAERCSFCQELFERRTATIASL